MNITMTSRILLTLLLCAPTTNAQTAVRGNLTSHVDSLIAAIPSGTGTGLYQPPGSTQQTPRGLPPGVTYDPAIPTPESFFGFAIGEWHIRHDQLLGYLKALDSASGRLTLEEYGRTYEQRALVLLPHRDGALGSLAHGSRSVAF